MFLLGAPPCQGNDRAERVTDARLLLISEEIKSRTIQDEQTVEEEESAWTGYQIDLSAFHSYTLQFLKKETSDWGIRNICLSWVLLNTWKLIFPYSVAARLSAKPSLQEGVTSLDNWKTIGPSGSFTMCTLGQETDSLAAHNPHSSTTPGMQRLSHLLRIQFSQHNWFPPGSFQTSVTSKDTSVSMHCPCHFINPPLRRTADARMSQSQIIRHDLLRGTP